MHYLFEHAQQEMGIDHLAKVGDTGKEIRKIDNKLIPFVDGYIIWGLLEDSIY